MSVILALKKLKQEDHEFQASLGYSKIMPKKRKKNAIYKFFSSLGC
jgi:hypothetical protein